MTALSPRAQRRDAIRASLRASLPRLTAELRRVEADLHSSYGVDRYGRGSSRLRARRWAIRARVAWRTTLAALVPAPVAGFEVAFRRSGPADAQARDHLSRPLRLASFLLPPGSRDRWAEEWRGELALLRGWRRLRWTLSTLRGLIVQAYILRRAARGGSL